MRDLGAGPADRRRLDRSARERRPAACAELERPLPPPAAVRLAVSRGSSTRRDAGGSAAERLPRALARLGPSYVKLGQFLATRPDVVGDDIALDLAMLQDQMAPFPQAEAVPPIEASLGRPIGELFASSATPVAAASIAQVHRGRSRAGRRGRWR